MEDKKANRLKELQNLKNCVEITDKNINDMIVSVGWTVERTKSSTRMLECPFDSSHHFSEKKLEEHLEHCQWKAEGYGEWDIPLSEPTISSNVHSSIKFDEQMLEQVLKQAKSMTPTMQIGAGNRLLPRTSNRIFSDLTSDERKAVYEYVITKTVKPNVGEDISNLNKLKEDNNKSSYLELLAHERDLKRRRAKHRGVHTNKKSHIEILREIVNQQMEMLEEYFNVNKNSGNQKDNVLHEDKETHCILNSTSKDIDYLDKHEITLKDNRDRRNLEKNIQNYNQHHNDSNYNHDYYRTKNYSSDDRKRKSSTKYQDLHEHKSKHYYKLSKKHDKNEEHYSSDKHRQFHEKSSKYRLSHDKYDDKQSKYSHKSMKYDKIREEKKSRKYDPLKHTTKIKHGCKISNDRRN
ncbi:U11/U12 small nuclear ribonucleoprotein 48 kDa protein-like [Chelonus insularis]|uniref:U11/U12 small nuclear ribonucleoprotein 48 kDa protein-like n=1 Tax=Chelonus insularis TaxID=460826 RepID=UPI00158BCBF7|nr:U11/U12 small nuclear ribonucleoprotein 48 kDa protein-like [Chelonus insularis]